jgi:hypothetical protein
MKRILLSAVLSFLCIASSDRLIIKSSKMYVPSRLGEIALTHQKGSFTVTQNGEDKAVQNYNMNKELRGIDVVKLKALMKRGYINVDQSCNGEYKLQYNARLRGGGGVLGYWAYCATKALCYGIGLAAAGGAVVATGGIAGAATGVLGAAATAGASTGAGIAAAAIAGSGGTALATTATAGYVAAAGGNAAVMVAGIESLSLCVGAFFGMMPTP